jgi:hypothetical protein
VLPPSETLIEWRLREIERAHDQRSDETSKDVRWLAFELRRARDALTQLLALANDLDDPLAPRIRLIANRAIGLYEIESDDPGQSRKP